MNVVKIVGMIVHHAPIDTMFIGRGVGTLVFPLGGLLGYF